MPNDTNSYPRLTVSLSGADGMGKNTLLSMFPRNWPFLHAGGIEEYSEDVRAMIRDQTWFGTGSDPLLREGACDDETFVLNLARACHERIAVADKMAGRGSDSISVLGRNRQRAVPGLSLDCSGQMFKAVSIARVMTLGGLALEDAVAKVDSILAAAGTSFPTETFAILIRLKGSLEERATYTLLQRGEPSETYRIYQHALQEVLQYQESQAVYTAVVDKSAAEPYIATLYRVTECLQRTTRARYHWQPLLANIQLAVAYGGLSECGKSSMCVATVRHRGDSAFRVKISYLCDLVSARLGKNMYDLPTNVRALELVHELDLFVRWHRWLTVVTLDSLHDYDLTIRLAQLIGSLPPGWSSSASPWQSAAQTVSLYMNTKLLVVYIDTPLHLRISRTEASGAHFDPSKDDVKMSRGTHKIEEIADLVVKNDGTFQSMFDTVWARAEHYL